MYLTIQCDECQADESEEPSVRYAKMVWREQGWTIGKRHICPECKALDSDLKDP